MTLHHSSLPMKNDGPLLRFSSTGKVNTRFYNAQGCSSSVSKQARSSS